LSSKTLDSEVSSFSSIGSRRAALIEGEWAWTGARQAGGAPDAAAAPELKEETGLVLPLAPLPEASASEDVAVYVAEAPANAAVDDEHDRFVWLPLAELSRMPTVGRRVRSR
jgi:hypothetical protein